MIRTITLLSLILATSTVFADGLYKWVEPDGSITFSPNPPPAGIEFERIGALKKSQANIESTAAKTTAPANQAKEQNSALSGVTPAEVSTESPKRLSYAPNGDTIKPGISRAEPSVAAASENADPAATIDTDETSITVAASKRSRCEDLQKRVVSLERRLKVRLSPADMDNTVVHMARYQKSYNRHCLR